MLGIARIGLALALVLSFGVSASGADEDPKLPKVKVSKLEPAQEKCVKACNDCVAACLACATHCADMLKADPKKADKRYQASLRWTMDCAETCALLTKVITRKGPAHHSLCEVCAKICDSCAKTCSELEHTTMKECVKTCKACAAACREMIKIQGIKK